VRTRNSNKLFLRNKPTCDGVPLLQNDKEENRRNKDNLGGKDKTSMVRQKEMNEVPTAL
jgi:hypothetical protein